MINNIAMSKSKISAGIVALVTAFMILAMAGTVAAADGVEDAGADIPDDFWAGPTVDNTRAPVDNEAELQSAVDDGVAGEVIYVDNDITLTSSLAITDENETIVSATDTRQMIDTGQYSIDIKDNGVNVKGLEIVGQNDDNSQTEDKGIKLTENNMSDIAIENNIIRGCWEPIIFTSTIPSHENITIANNELSGEWIGIMAFNVDDSEIRNNYIHDIDVGIQMSAYGSGNQPENNIIKNVCIWLEVSSEEFS